MSKFAFIALLAIPLAAACATSEPPIKGAAAFADDPRLGKQVDEICFNRSIDGFKHNTKDTVVLTKSVSDEYLVEVRGHCRDLKYAQSIGLDSYSTCLRDQDYIIVSTSAFSLSDGTGLGPDRCYIDAIYEWDDDADKDALENEVERETKN